MTTSDNIRSNINQLVEPLRDQLDELDTELATAEKSLAFLRQTRRDLVRVLSLIDPTFVTATPVVKVKGSPPPLHVSHKTLEDIRQWLYEHSNQLSKESFSAASIRKTHGFSMYSQSITLTALKILHNEGFLRLDHTGVAGSRYYKVVSGG